MSSSHPIRTLARLRLSSTILHNGGSTTRFGATASSSISINTRYYCASSSNSSLLVSSSSMGTTDEDQQSTNQPRHHQITNPHFLLRNQSYSTTTPNPSDKPPPTTPPPPPPTKTTGKSTKQDQKKPKKENFAKKFLEPAARGELPRRPGIPKLAARKGKGQAVHDEFPGSTAAQSLETTTTNKAAASGGATKGKGGARPNTTRFQIPTPKPSQQSNKPQQSTALSAIVQKASKHRHRQKALQQSQSPQGKLAQRATQAYNHNRRLILDKFTEPTPIDLNPMTATHNNRQFVGPRAPNVAGKSFRGQKRPKHRGGRGGRRDDKQTDIFGDEIPKEEIDDPWLSDTLQFEYKDVAPESMRKAVGRSYPRGRMSPPKEFVGRFGVFGYVGNIECPQVKVEKEGVVEEGAPNQMTWAKFENPLERLTIADTVAEKLNVPVENVFPSTNTTAFVGFKDAMEAAENYLQTEKNRVWRDEACRLSVYDEAEELGMEDVPAANVHEEAFVGSATKEGEFALLRLANVPSGMRAVAIANYLHNVLPLNPDTDVFFSSPTLALLRIPTKESYSHQAQLQSILNNNNTKEKSSSSQTPILQLALATMGRQSLTITTAHRQIVHDNPIGPTSFYLTQKLSDTRPLLVNGDLPTHQFYISHANVLHLTNVPPHVTQKMVSDYFQKWSVEMRDVVGSVEVVVDLEGKSLGRAYVGFDTVQEYDAAWSALEESNRRIQWPSTKSTSSSSSTTTATNTTTLAHSVHEQPLIRGQKFGPRTYRTAAELHHSIHNSWRDYVTPDQLQLLADHDISETVLEDAFLATRNYNPTFGVEDQARVGEKLKEGYEPGQHFKEFVEGYVEALVASLVTREEPGELYEGMFFEGEEMDYELFDREESRVKDLAGEKYYGK